MTTTRSGGSSLAFIRIIVSGGDGSRPPSAWRGHGPPVVSAGDLVDDLPAVLGEVPNDAQLVVFHSAVLTYVKPERRQAFAGVLAEASRKRDIVWLSNEPPGVVPEVSALAPPQNELRYLLSRTRFRNGQRRDELLALAHVHGADLTWL
jgi:hypothetical protein